MYQMLQTDTSTSDSNCFETVDSLIYFQIQWLCLELAYKFLPHVGNKHFRCFEAN